MRELIELLRDRAMRLQEHADYIVESFGQISRAKKLRYNVNSVTKHRAVFSRRCRSISRWPICSMFESSFNADFRHHLARLAGSILCPSQTGHASGRTRSSVRCDATDAVDRVTRALRTDDRRREQPPESLT